MQIRIFQIDSDYDEDSLKFLDLYQVRKQRGDAGIDSAIYEEVFRGDLDCADPEEIFDIFNRDMHPLFRGHSLSVSDIVLIEGNAYFCDSVGFQKVDFDPALTHKSDNLLQIVYVEPGRAPFVSDVGADLMSMQKAVLGPLDTVYNRDGTVLIMNDESKLVGMKGNRRVDGSIIAGNFFAVGDDGETFRSLTDAETERYMERFAQPEDISQEKVEENSGLTFMDWK